MHAQITSLLFLTPCKHNVILEYLHSTSVGTLKQDGPAIATRSRFPCSMSNLQHRKELTDLVAVRTGNVRTFKPVAAVVVNANVAEDALVDGLLNPS